MATRYTPDQLLSLRDSPLVSRPTTLPPTEDWMGPPPENQRRPPHRGKLDEIVTHETGNRRPFVDRRSSRGSSNIPEDIVLGPPKTAFASASGARNPNRAFDSPNRTNFGVQPDDGKGDRHSLRERSSRQGQKADVDGERLQEPRNGNTRFRRGTNDHDPWYGRQERSLGTDDSERGTYKGAAREQEKDRDNNRDSKNSRTHDIYRRDARETNGDTRRNGSARRHESAWHREGKETDNSEGRRNTTKPRDWRDKETGDTRITDREWLPNVKSERDPEWMDELEVQEKKQTHTQEDFERWKERMKAGNIPSQEFDNGTSQQGSDHHRNVSGISVNEGKSKAETPLVVDQTFDGFFGLWNEPAKKAVTDVPELQAKDTRQSKAPKASKFTNFFGAPTPALARVDPGEVDELSAPDALKSSSSEDKEGFQRILKLLDQQQLTTKDDKPKEQNLRNAPASPSTQGSLNWDSSFQSLLRPNPGQGNLPIQNRDSEFLLKLMQQPRANAPNETQPSSSNAPGLLPFSNRMVSQHQSPDPGPPPGFSSDGIREDSHNRNMFNPSAVSERRGPPPGLFDGSRSGPIDSQRLGKSGLDFKPSLVNQLPPSRPSVMPPPGFQAPLRSPAQFPPGLLSRPTSEEQGNPYAMRAGGNPPPPPGMPPPGFMTAPPPPGFPPTQFNLDGPGHMFYGGALQRPPMEGFGELGRFDMGQGGLPGQFRRQE